MNVIFLLFLSFLNHLVKLIDAIHILCGLKITSERIKHANRLLLSFVDQFEDFYGEANMVFNVHQLRHLADCVEMNGPLFAYSNYCMEDNIGHIVSLVKGTTDVSTQICSKYLLEKNMFAHLVKSEKAYEFHRRIESRLRFTEAKKQNGCLMIGKPLKNSNMNENDFTFVTNFLKLTPEDQIFEYNSFLLNCKIFFETVANSIGKRTNDSFIHNIETNQFADIKAIFTFEDQIYLLVNEKYQITDKSNSRYSKFLDDKTQHDRKIITIESIGQKHALIEFDTISVCSPFPNLHERN